MKYVLAVLKGILIGLAVLIPGVSGGSMILSMGIYEQAISITSRDKKVRRNAFVFLLPYILGIVIGVLGLAFLIEWLMTNYLFETAMCFIGMILGSLPMLLRKVKGKKFSLVGALLFVLMVAIMVVLPHLSQGSASLSVSFTGAVLGIALGFIAAGTMIVPGISGSMVMLVLGYYNDLLSHITGLQQFDKSTFFGHFFVLAFFGIGVLLGLLLVSRGIKWLLTHKSVPTYYAIMGLMVASPYPIILKSNFNWSALTLSNLIFGGLALLLGFFLAMLLDRKEAKA